MARINRGFTLTRKSSSARRKRAKKLVIKRGQLFKQRPTLRGDEGQVVVFKSPCCSTSMRVFPFANGRDRLEYQPFLRCRTCRRFWKVYLLPTKRGKIRSVHLTA